MLNVRRFPPHSSRTYQLHYIGAETREEGGTRCQRALAAEWDRGAEKIGQQEVAETASVGMGIVKVLTVLLLLSILLIDPVL